MKLADFVLENKGDSPWQTASRSNLIATGTKGGKKYQIKLHSGEPKWFLVDDAIRDKEAEIRACPASDEEKKERLQSELATMKSDRANRNAKDKYADGYFELKQRFVAELKRIGSSQIIGPEEFWKERVDFKGNSMFAVEAVPWVNNIAVGFDSGSRIQFNRDLSLDEQYNVVASLCDQLAKLHRAGILHSDLKQGNTLVTKEGGKLQATIIDFDSAVLLSDLRSKRYPQQAWYYIIGGTHFAPELYKLFVIARESPDEEAFKSFDFNTITEKADIFSLGVTIYEYFFGLADGLGSSLMPFVSPDGNEALDIPLYGLAVEQGYKLNLPDSVNDLLYASLNWMVASNPNDRPTAEQVRDIFKNRDISAVPSKYTRNPLWEEHQGKYELTLPAGVSIVKAFKPRYRIITNGMSVVRNIDDLVRENYAKRVGEEAEKPSNSELSKLWPTDGNGDLPACVTRSSVSGRYLIYSGGTSRSVTYNQLVADGYICSEEDRATPWPCDKGLRFTSAKTICRDMGLGKGAGYYVIGSGISAMRYTKQKLIDSGLASTTVSFSLHQSDAVSYEPNFDGIPPKVKAVTRNALVNHQYKVEYEGGRIDRLSIDDMLAKGFVKRK